MLAIDNDSTDPKARALDLRVEPDRTPITVNSDRKVNNLNADQVDGVHASDLPPRGYVQVDHFNPANPSTGERSFIVPGSSKGVIDIVRTDDPGHVYCFDLSFVPSAAGASAHINNNATVGTTVMQSTVDSKCGTATDFEAAAVTYAANTDPSPPRSDISFGIAFM